MYLKNLFVLVFLFLISCRSIVKQDEMSTKQIKNKISLVKIETDTLFNSRQEITKVFIPNKLLNNYYFDVAYNETLLQKTSYFGKQNGAVLALNGSFFDTKAGGSITYFEVQDSVISPTKSRNQVWDKEIINGFLVLKDKKIIIEKFKPDTFFEASKGEDFVLRAGPVLLKDGLPEKLTQDEKFSIKRHPRTCIATLPTGILLMTVDGRQENAEGMSLNELQSYLIKIGCIDAINLDGGGSTAMWHKHKGLLNSPSDKTGERAVSNAILLKKAG